MKRQLLDEIINGVEKEGFYELSMEVLETVLGQGDRRRPHTKEQFLQWADEKRLNYEYKERDNETIILFSKRSEQLPGMAR
jgi:hypothetical protein